MAYYLHLIWLLESILIILNQIFCEISVKNSLKTLRQCALLTIIRTSTNEREVVIDLYLYRLYICCLNVLRLLVDLHISTEGSPSPVCETICLYLLQYFKTVTFTLKLFPKRLLFSLPCVSPLVFVTSPEVWSKQHDIVLLFS